MGLQWFISGILAASQQEILRSAERDEKVVSQLETYLSKLIYKIGGNQWWWLRIPSLGTVLGGMVYSTFTTLAGVQTLGEEYTGIIQVRAPPVEIPGKLIFFLMTILHCGGEIFVKALLEKAEKTLKSENVKSKLQPNAQLKLLKWVRTAKALIPYLQDTHSGIFYLHGTYYHLAKRISGIKYVLLRPSFEAHSNQRNFRLIGTVKLLNVVFSLVNFYLNQEDDTEQTDIMSSQPANSPCPLCLDEKKRPAAAPCGHVFCWECIMASLTTKQQCPLCRQQVSSSRVVLINNL